MSYTTVISTEALAAHLANPAWLIADCRYSLKIEQLGQTQYVAGHIPGAIFVNIGHDLAGPRTGSNGRHPLPSLEAMVATFGRLGIARDTQVVAYDQDAGQYASRLWWMLRYLGHDAVAVLDGGWIKWIGEGRPVRTGEEHKAAVTFTPRIQTNMSVTVDEAAARVGDPALLFVDARSPERFEGRPDPLDNVPGHIPGAHNRFYKNNLAEDGTLRPADALRDDFRRVLGDRSPAQVVMYCGSGVTACQNLLAMEHAGMPGAKLFVGSWSEWESDPTRPVEKGVVKD